MILNETSAGCSIDDSKISKIEHGRINLTLSTILELAKGLDVSPFNICCRKNLNKKFFKLQNQAPAYLKKVKAAFSEATTSEALLFKGIGDLEMELAIDKIFLITVSFAIFNTLVTPLILTLSHTSFAIIDNPPALYT